MNAEVRELVVRYLIMGLVLSAGAVIAAVWADMDRKKMQAAQPAPATAPAPAAPAAPAAP